MLGFSVSEKRKKINFPIYDTFFLRLFFRSVQPEDAGKYECQISTLPKMSHFLYLSVIGKLFHINKIFLEGNQYQND